MKNCDFDFDTFCRISNEYFNWLCSVISDEAIPYSIRFRKLLTHLHGSQFKSLLARDENRASDGMALRYRFQLLYGDEQTLKYLDGPCSILEMMIALALKCEETIMDDPAIGNRTKQWFWQMIVSLGLGGQDDEFYDRSIVNKVIHRFLYREYSPNGSGGLFTIYDCKEDLRDKEIWYQLMRHLDRFDCT